MPEGTRADRAQAVAEAKRSLILDAALRVFARDGLRGASIRSIATEAGYAPGALYGYYPSKEHLYAAALHDSLRRLGAATGSAGGDGPAQRYFAAGLAFFDFYDANPRDLDMGFYLFGGGMAPRGLDDPEIDRGLNEALLAALEPVRGAAEELAGPAAANRLTAEAFAHAAGLLLLRHTRRLHLFGLDARALMHGFLDGQLAGAGG